MSDPNSNSVTQQVGIAAFIVTLIGLPLAILVAAWMFGMPYYWVFHQHQEGKAMLAKAEYSKQVMVQDAMAREQSAKSLAQAEVIRADGVAKANKIIGESLENNKEYLHYLWIHNLEGNDNVIYVATESGMPIFEAGGRFQPRRGERAKPGEPGTIENTDASTPSGTLERKRSDD